MSDPSEDESKLPQQLALALLVPILLLGSIGGVLYAQIAEMREQARWVAHSNEITSRAFEVLARIVDQETGVRGYVLTHDRAFLEPYVRAHPEQLLADLGKLVADNPGQRARVVAIRERYERWHSTVEGLIEGGTFDEAVAPAAMAERRRRMDEVRRAVAGLIRAERSLHRTREIRAERAASLTSLVLAGLLGIAAIVIAFGSRRLLMHVVSTFRAALERERATRAALEDEAFVRRAQLAVTAAVQGDLEPPEIGRRALAVLADQVSMDVGVFHALEGSMLRARAGHAWDPRTVPDGFALGEGLVGQVAAENRSRHLRELPKDFLHVVSGAGARGPVELVIAPMTGDGIVHGVIELGFLRAIDPRVLDLVERIGHPIAVALRSAEYRQRLRALLDESRRQTDELATQGEEMQVQNEELEEQSSALQEAQRRLEVQHVELEQANQSLRRQTEQLETRNDDLIAVQRELTEKSDEAGRANRYKSEFLANMSHELRTPLNSSLILAKLLAENKGGNLTPEQVRFAETIYGAGNDLLALINDVLDLSKIEAGHVEVSATSCPVARVVEPVVRTFEPIVSEKKLVFDTRIDPEVASIHADVQKVQQILKNLLSNAFKFTEHGEVGLRVFPEGESIVFEVRDTGIGIAPAQHDLIFEAFRQADGTTNRKYGGTGLGLSISRDLARLMGGELTLASEVGRGSAFTLRLPRELSAAPAIPAVAEARPPVRREPRPIEPRSALAERKREPARLVEDDRDRLDAGRTRLLVVEDDAAFAEILVQLARELGFQCIVAADGEEGLALAARHSPSAIVLDMHLPDVSGLSILERLKRSPTTRHVPVHVVSVADYTQTALEMGAIGYALKPVKREELVVALRRLEETFTRSVRRLLIVEDDLVQRDGICRLLQNGSVETVAVGTVAEALEQLRGSAFDCIVTDLSLPDASGYELLETMSREDGFGFPPVIVYTGRSLTASEEQQLRKHSDSIIVKGARSPDRLLDEVTLFLHQVESDLPADRQRMLRQARDRDHVFEGRRVLVVEDDVRNVFALTSVLESKGATIDIARNGREALEALERTPDVDLVLMDVMMPEMDGLEATRRIRQQPRFAKLPVIALTAKAMKDDQESCLRAGANDYVAKPLDVDMLLSLLRVWMPK